MQVLKVLSEIWKSGATIEQLPKGKLKMHNPERVPTGVMDSAKAIFPEIEKWYASWKNASPEDVTIQKALHLFCGWQGNDKINHFLTSDIDSLMLLHDWTVVLAKNGWTDMYTDYRRYENGDSNKMKIEFYKRAVAFTKKGA